MRSNLSVLGVLLLLSAAQAGSYTVQKNDTLYSLSRRFGLSVEELMKLNHLDAPNIALGQVLQVPDVKIETKPDIKSDIKTDIKVTPEVKTLSPAPKEHIVARQETLFGIARKYGIKLEDLKRWNTLTSNEIAIGQVLKLQGDAGNSGPGAPATSTADRSPSKTETAKTESSKTEAAKTDPVKTSVKNEVKASSGSKTQGVKSDVVKTPSKAETAKTEPVKVETTKTPVKTSTAETKTTNKTETAKTPVTTSKTEPTKTEVLKTETAKTEPVKVESTKTPVKTSTAETTKSGSAKTEPLKTETAKTTEPPKTEPLKAEPKEAKVKPVLSGAITYVVERGDTLYALARRFEVTVDELMAWNALDSSTLGVGQSLQLIARVQPVPTPASDPVMVKTPAVIEDVKASSKEPAKEPVKEAAREPVKVASTLKPAEADQMTIKPVQVVDNAVVIAPVSNPERHIVQKGDTLSVLARKYSTTVGALQEANSLTDTNLRVGQVLILPSTIKSIPEPSSLVNIVGATPNPWRDYAMSLLNIPYVYGGANPDKGLDCSGFTLLVMQQAGVQLPRTSMEQSQIGEVVDRSDLKEGDLIFFDTLGHGVSHVGIYLGDNQFIHANSYLERVSIDDITNTYYARRVVGVRRVLSPLTAAQQ
ncbi:LysM peptidoglycan-binding domain-containing protein [Deinococcus roseus]|uniref:Peptidoglycan endopeptidase n=1 Tax=Deinococcus roseus TaxID=392414 RepID=A0ABQ2D0M4_9DEIO|nr:LysM peptidoglycan-binding domain-containing protein [Deinococcus roseus]GGJ35027.1 hypothetical protein GCM10008938_21410 [Deinococcus roseus]